MSHLLGSESTTLRPRCASGGVQVRAPLLLRIGTLQLPEHSAAEPRVGGRSSGPSGAGSDAARVTTASWGCAVNTPSLFEMCLGTYAVSVRSVVCGGVHPAARGGLRRAGVLLLRDRPRPGAEGPAPGGREARRALPHRPLPVGAGEAEAGGPCERPVPPARGLFRAARDARRPPVLRRGGEERPRREEVYDQVRGLRGRLPGRARPGADRPPSVPRAQGLVRGTGDEAKCGAAREGVLRPPVRAVLPGPSAGV